MLNKSLTLRNSWAILTASRVRGSEWDRDRLPSSTCRYCNLSSRKDGTDLLWPSGLGTLKLNCKSSLSFSVFFAVCFSSTRSDLGSLLSGDWALISRWNIFSERTLLLTSLSQLSVWVKFLLSWNGCINFTLGNLTQNLTNAACKSSIVVSWLVGQNTK